MRLIGKSNHPHRPKEPDPGNAGGGNVDRTKNKLPSKKGSFLFGEILMKALILVNGKLNNIDVLKRRIQTSAFDIIIGTDGGARYANILNVDLDVIIGDMDSLSDLEQEAFKNVKIVSYPGEKDEIDLELALLYAIKQRANIIVLVGAMGGRMDMAIANILLIAHSKFHSCRIEVWHGEQTGWIIKPPGENIPGNYGDTLSLIPINGRASGISTTGLKFPLDSEELTFAPARGISNVMEKQSVHIKLNDGLLLVVHTPGRA